MFSLIDKDAGGENFGEGNSKYRKFYDYSIIGLAGIQIFVMSVCYGIQLTTQKNDYITAMIILMISIDQLLNKAYEVSKEFFDQKYNEVNWGIGLN